jgi:hypothetical protein
MAYFHEKKNWKFIVQIDTSKFNQYDVKKKHMSNIKNFHDMLIWNFCVHKAHIAVVCPKKEDPILYMTWNFYDRVLSFYLSCKFQRIQELMI